MNGKLGIIYEKWMIKYLIILSKIGFINVTFHFLLTNKEGHRVKNRIF